MYNPDRYSIMIKYGANGNWLSVILLKIFAKNPGTFLLKWNTV